MVTQGYVVGTGGGDVGGGDQRRAAGAVDRVVTDVQAAGSKATGVAIPAEQNAVTNYPLVVTKQATNTTTASAFIASVASPAGQAILAKYGFLAP